MNEVFLDNLIKELVDNGAVFDTEKIKNRLKNIIINDDINNFLNELERIITKYQMNPENEVNTIAVTIGIDSNKISLSNQKIEDNTLFDVASITKVFVLKLVYEFEKLGLIKYTDVIKDICPEFADLDGYTVIDAIKMYGKIETNGKLSSSINKENFIRTLESVKVIDYSYESSNYTDIGFIVLGYVLESISCLTLPELMKKYIFDVYDLKYTMFNPNMDNYILLGNGNNTGMPQDFKTRINDGVTGAAGIFTNSIDMLKLSLLLYNYEFFDEEFIKRMLEDYFFDEKGRKRTYAGLYISTDDIDISYAPKEFSNITLAHQGFTGSVVIFDIKNKMHISILLDAIKLNASKKTERFIENFYAFKSVIVEYSLILYLLARYNSKK